MTQQVINIGALPNDGTGDPIRVAYSKINQNFNELFSSIVSGTGLNIDLDFGTFTSSSASLNIDLGTIT